MESLPPSPAGITDDRLKIIALTSVESTLALLFVIGRIYSRTRLIHNMGSDDWMMILAMLLSLGTMIINTLEAHYGAGRNFIFLNHHDRTKVLMIMIASQSIPAFGACFAKISVALLLKRIMNRNKAQGIFLWFIIILVFITNCLFIASTFLQCIPVQRFWDPSVAGACRNHDNEINMTYFQGTNSAFTDFALAFFSIILLRNIQMKRSTKVGLCFLMSLGIIAGIAAVVRVVKQVEFQRYPISFAPVIYWYTTELNLIIITACIPTLKPLFVEIKHLIRRRQDISPNLSEDSKRLGLRNIRKTTEIQTEFIDNHELPNLSLTAVNTGASAEAEVKEEEQVV